MTKCLIMYRIASLRMQHPILAILCSMAYIATFGSAAYGFTMFLLAGGLLSPGMSVVTGIGWGVGMAPSIGVMFSVPAILSGHREGRWSSSEIGVLTVFVMCLTLLSTLSTFSALTPLAQSPLFTTIGVTLLPLGWIIYCTDTLATFVIPIVVSMRVKCLSRDVMRAKSLAEFERLIELCKVTSDFDKASVLSQQMISYAEHSR